MIRTEIINKFIKKYKFSSYLEIGTRNKDHNFNKVRCREKLCIDPDKDAEADLVLTSDEFFKINNKKFDFIFIDGLHEAHQVYKDIQNSIKVLNEGGVIMCHDCNPISLISSTDFEEYNGSIRWNGDCWKAFAKYRYNSEYLCYVLDEDEGCGIIDTHFKAEIEEKIKIYIGELTYSILEENRNKLLDLRKEIRWS